MYNIHGQGLDLLDKILQSVLLSWEDMDPDERARLEGIVIKELVVAYDLGVSAGAARERNPDIIS